MRPFCPRTAIVRTSIVLALVSGCASDADKGRSQDPIVTAAAPPKESGLLPPKKANLPDLPDGAGKMDDNAPDEFTPTPSGLYYRILRKGNRHKPRSYDMVVVHYRGWLDDGHQFDSSYDRAVTTEFSVDKVVPGWQEGLQLIGEGGMIELEVPSRLGYGGRGMPPTIPPNSTLHFIVELQKIK
jgi:FKBP-type peptidyl-prolyl cis-trans isomerase FkpA